MPNGCCSLQVSRLCQSRVEHTHRAWCLDAFFSDGIQAVIGSTSFNGDVKLWDNPSLDMKTKVCMHCTRCFVTYSCLHPTPLSITHCRVPMQCLCSDSTWLAT